ncbi:hypothetical protein LTR62_008190 [Meristemomyces frigidus]|uniref:Uncharacterized protein n=1 Tax=Meristemomyces frigidus TaxID=1508187 RepID=A0AAN7TAX4_9PEZI|nr:hypothetical protein LTR62_008190 [Meristemomyces frigidus]
MVREFRRTHADDSNQEGLLTDLGSGHTFEMATCSTQADIPPSYEILDQIHQGVIRPEESHVQHGNAYLPQDSLHPTSGFIVPWSNALDACKLGPDAQQEDIDWPSLAADHHVPFDARSQSNAQNYQHNLSVPCDESVDLSYLHAMVSRSGGHEPALLGNLRMLDFVPVGIWQEDVNTAETLVQGTSTALESLVATLRMGIIPSETSGDRYLCGLRALIGTINANIPSQHTTEPSFQILDISTVLAAMYVNHHAAANHDPHFRGLDNVVQLTPDYTEFLYTLVEESGMTPGSEAFDSRLRELSSTENLGVDQLATLPRFLRQQNILNFDVVIGILTAGSRNDVAYIHGDDTRNWPVAWLYNDNAQSLRGAEYNHWSMFARTGLTAMPPYALPTEDELNEWVVWSPSALVPMSDSSTALHPVLQRDGEPRHDMTATSGLEVPVGRPGFGNASLYPLDMQADDPFEFTAVTADEYNDVPLPPFWDGYRALHGLPSNDLHASTPGDRYGQQSAAAVMPVLPDIGWGVFDPGLPNPALANNNDSPPPYFAGSSELFFDFGSESVSPEPSSI